MDKIKKYQAFIKKAIKKHHAPDTVHQYDEFESQMTFDDEHGHYYLINVGWNKYDRIFSPMLHIDLKGEKIWIHQDWTEGIVNDFLEMRVPKEDIVLAFHAPYKRKHTSFATTD